MYFKIYYGICVCITIILTTWCVYEYSLDPDVSNIALRKFHETSEDIHPTITLCVKDPFNLGVLMWSENQSYSNTLRSYQTFITGIGQQGRSIDDFPGIDYDRASASLNEFLEEFSIHVRASSVQTHAYVYRTHADTLLINEKETPWMDEYSPDYDLMRRIRTYISVRNGYFKCFSFDIPMSKEVIIQKVEIKINATWASSGENILDLSRFFVMLTYPNQMLLTSPGKHILLKNDFSQPSCYKSIITLGAMEILRRRDKSKVRCNENWKNHDQMLINHIIENVGCNPKHWYTPSKLGYCNSTNQYKKVEEKIFETGFYMPPCRSIVTLPITTFGRDPGWRCPLNGRYLDISFDFDKERFYKEISVVSGYTFQSLIGTAGISIYFELLFFR